MGVTTCGATHHRHITQVAQVILTSLIISLVFRVIPTTHNILTSSPTHNNENPGPKGPNTPLDTATRAHATAEPFINGEMAEWSKALC